MAVVSQRFTIFDTITASFTIFDLEHPPFPLDEC